MKGALRIGSSLAAGNAGTQAVDSIFSSEANTIKELRKQLHSLVEEIKELESNPYQRVVVYVDDLDRIDPEDAVSILELLKNIFNIKDCVFVLAIDYQVVVKGLKENLANLLLKMSGSLDHFLTKLFSCLFRCRWEVMTLASMFLVFLMTLIIMKVITINLMKI